jgi:hypothetical protein
LGVVLMAVWWIYDNCGGCAGLLLNARLQQADIAHCVLKALELKLIE